MFERFTERARQVVVFAQVEARQLNHNYIGTEHLLLGLLREPDWISARVLNSLGVTLEEVRSDVARIVGEGDAAVSGQLPFTPRAKKVLELSLHEAVGLGHNYIGAEHLLLGLARENSGVASRILLDDGVEADQIRREIGNALQHDQDPGAHAVESRLVSAPDPAWIQAHRDPARYLPLIVGWLLFAVAGALGVLVGWLIWG